MEFDKKPETENVSRHNMQHGQLDQGQQNQRQHHLQRRLNNRQIQLLAIGGTIGTALFLIIGNGLAAKGPGSLLLAYILYCQVLACINNCITEMTVLHPVSGGFIRLASKWVDESLGFMVGWIIFLYEALMIPFEITAISIVLSYWRDDIPAAAVCAACIALFAVLKILVVQAFGEAEFWLSGGKVISLAILFMFTFITMVGGNAEHDVYGFQNWRHPGAFAEYRSPGDLGRFEGFLACLWSAAFTIVGPEYLSIAAAETQRPRAYLKTAFKTVYFRFGAFFVLGSLCVGIVIPSNDPTLQSILAGEVSAQGATGSPYVIAMANMNVKVLPHIVNALLITTIVLSGNTMTYCATQSLYSLALDGHAPRMLRRTTKNGVPIYAFSVVILFPFLSFLQLSDNASNVLTWLISSVTADILIVYLVMCITYVQFYCACRDQGVNRASFPYTGLFQPYYAYIAFDPWNVEIFFQNRTMQLLAPVLYLGWKLTRRTKSLRSQDNDLIWEHLTVDAYEAQFMDPAAGFWTEMAQLVHIKRRVRSV